MEEKLDQRLVDVAGLMHILCMSRPQLQRMINDEDINFPSLSCLASANGDGVLLTSINGWKKSDEPRTLPYVRNTGRL